MKKNLFYLSSAVLLLTVLAIGCGQQTAKVAQNNSSPVGSITGEIYDQDSNAALSGAHAYVLLNGGYQNSTANALGAYSLSSIPLGAVYTVTYTAGNYATPIYNVDLTNVSVSLFPQGNAVIQQNVGMFQLGAAISGTVTNGISGGCPSTTGLQGATVTLDLRNIGNGTPFAGFDILAQATTDASGNYTIANLPGSLTGSFPGQAGAIRVCVHTISGGQYYYQCRNVSGLFPGSTTPGMDMCVQ